MSLVKRYLRSFVLFICCFLLLGIRSYAVQGVEVHFIDVGQGDATLIVCDEDAMLIDGGSRDASSLIYAYLQQHDVSKLKYIIATHADEDHVGGLAGALNAVQVETAYCSVLDNDTKVFQDFLKYLKKQKISLQLPKVGDTLKLGSANIEILGPLLKDEHSNNGSIVCRLDYKDVSFLFTGDAEELEEQQLLESGSLLKSDLIKIGHHGSGSSSSEAFLDAVAPGYAVISVGKDNDYGHPSDVVLKRLEKRNIDVYRTDKQGTIVLQSDGKKIIFPKRKNAVDAGITASAAALTKSLSGEDYVLNTNTHKFHYPFCSSVSDIKLKNRTDFTGSREEVIAQGYVPCKRCKP